MAENNHTTKKEPIVVHQDSRQAKCPRCEGKGYVLNKKKPPGQWRQPCSCPYSNGWVYRW